MTVLSPQVPVLSVEDSFRLVYSGTYGRLDYDKATNVNAIEVVKGPLPEGKFVWDGVDYLGGMTKGEERFIPFDIVRVYFGDPRSIMTGGQRFEDRKGQPGDIAPRPEETRRLSVLYGLYDTDAARVKDIVPVVTITTAEGAEVICPATDPLGHHVYGHVANSAENYDMATTIEQMKMQIRMLEEQQKVIEQRGHDNSGADVEVDEPRRRGAATG
jgi:hypothetical protein